MLTPVQDMWAPLVGLQENQTKPGDPHHGFPYEHSWGDAGCVWGGCSPCSSFFKHLKNYDPGKA